MNEIKLKSGRILQVIQDENPESPRTWDNLGTMVCWHRNYELGDNHKFDDNDDFMRTLANADDDSEESDQELLTKINQTHVILPLYLYDHSGITMNTEGFSCRFDSGQVGWIFCSLEKATENWPGYKTWEDTMPDWHNPGQQITLREATERCLEGEVKTFDQYITGDVYGFKLIERKDCIYCGVNHERELDSCWGFFGDDIKENGILDHLSEEDQPLDQP